MVHVHTSSLFEINIQGGSCEAQATIHIKQRGITTAFKSLHFQDVSQIGELDNTSVHLVLHYQLD